MSLKLRLIFIGFFLIVIGVPLLMNGNTNITPLIIFSVPAILILIGLLSHIRKLSGKSWRENIDIAESILAYDVPVPDVLDLSDDELDDFLEHRSKLYREMYYDELDYIDEYEYGDNDGF